MAIPLSYNLRNILQRPVSTATTALGVAFTVAILIGAMALASGFQAALLETGSNDNLLVLRKGADSEISSGITRDAVNILRALPDVATAADGHPLASAEVVVLTNRPRVGQTGTSNVTVRGVDPEALAFRSRVKIVEGRMFAPGTAEIAGASRTASRTAASAIACASASRTSPWWATSRPAAPRSSPRCGATTRC